MAKFYSLFGSNGAGVYNSWSKVLQSRGFLTACNTKGFSSYAEAAAFTVERFNQCIYSAEYSTITVDDLKMNWVIFHKDRKRYYPIVLLY